MTTQPTPASLFFGNKLTANPAETLTKINLSDLYQTISQPTTQLKDFVARLRQIRSLDEKKYHQLKVQLPYFVGALFHPTVRHQANFVSIDYFVLDLDHLSEHHLEAEALKSRFLTDDRVALAFISPSGDGLKVVFRLADKCFDSRLYSHFYKKFVADFARTFQLEECLDGCTCDVSRVCFISPDPLAYFNEWHQPVSILPYLDGDADIFAVASADASRRGQVPATIPAKTFPTQEENRATQVIGDETMEEILRKLNPERRYKPARQIFVPPMLHDLATSVAPKVAEHQIGIREVVNINYGKKFVFERGRAFAEINVFHGKNGYSVVKTPKKGTHPQLTDIAYHLLCQLVYEDAASSAPEGSGASVVVEECSLF